MGIWDPNRAQHGISEKCEDCVQQLEHHLEDLERCNQGGIEAWLKEDGRNAVISIGEKHREQHSKDQDAIFPLFQMLLYIVAGHAHMIPHQHHRDYKQGWIQIETWQDDHLT